LAIPTYELSKLLNTKVAFGFIGCFAGVEYINKKPVRELELDDISIYYSLTGTETEKIFFSVNILASLKFSGIFKAVY